MTQEEDDDDPFAAGGAAGGDEDMPDDDIEIGEDIEVEVVLDEDDNGGDELLVTTRPSPPDACGRIGVFDTDPPNDDRSSVSVLTWTELPSPSCPAFASPPAGPSRDVSAFTLPSSTSLSSMTSTSSAFSVDTVSSVASEAVFASLSSFPSAPGTTMSAPRDDTTSSESIVVGALPEVLEASDAVGAISSGDDTGTGSFPPRRRAFRGTVPRRVGASRAFPDDFVASRRASQLGRRPTP